MRKIIILCIVLLVAISAIAIKYFSRLSGSQNTVEQTLQFIPQDAALILNFNNDKTFYEIFKDYELFDAIVGESRMSEIQTLQQLLLQQPAFADATSDKKIFISFHVNKTDSIDFLYSINLDAKLQASDVDKLLHNAPNIQINSANENGFYKLMLKTLSRPFYLFVQNGAAVGSFSQSLLESCMNKDVPKLDKAFINEITQVSSHSQNSPVNLFINHYKISSFIANFINGRASGNTGLLTKIRGFSSLNMNFKSDALMFNGISKPDTSTANYLNLYLSQQPVENELKEILPKNTANFIAFGMSNYNKFYGQLQKLLLLQQEQKQLLTQLKSIENKTSLDLNRDLKPLFGNEFTILETAGREKLGIIKLNNGRKASFSLRLVSDEWSENISRFNYSHILYSYFGNPLKPFARPYFSIIDNYLVFANTPGVIQNYLTSYQNQDFLIKTPEFAEYNQLLANKTNILFFINNKNSERVINAVLKRKYSEAFRNKNYGLKDFYGFSYQWSADDGHFFTNIYINYKSPGNREQKEAWKLQLKARLASTPQIASSGQDNVILVQDKANNLYAVSEDGKELWSTQLNGKILGRIHQLSDNSIVFNTHNRLYRLKIDGESVPKFPVNLPFLASFGLTATNASSEQSSLFIPAGNLIMAFKTNGEALPGWNKSLNGKILPGLETANYNLKNYIIAGTQNGYFYFFDEAGKELKTIHTDGMTFENSLEIEAGSALTDVEIITADSEGNLVSIPYNGKPASKKIYSPQNGFSFNYKNIAGDDKPELIYMDKTGVNTFNLDGTPLYTYNVILAQKTKPLFFSVNKYKFQLGFTDSENSQLLVLNDEGNLVKGFPIKGNYPFCLTNQSSSGNRYLISGNNENYLLAYRL